MHEDAVAAITEIERHRLVHAVGFRSLGVGDIEMHLLPHLVERGERLTTSINAFARREEEHGIDGTGVVASPFDKREGQQFYLRGVIVDDRAAAGEHTPVGIPNDKAPWVFLNLDASVLAFIAYGIGRAGSLPRMVCRHRTAKHRILGILILGCDRCGEHGDTYRSWTDEP